MHRLPGAEATGPHGETAAGMCAQVMMMMVMMFMMIVSMMMVMLMMMMITMIVVKKLMMFVTTHRSIILKKLMMFVTTHRSIIVILQADLVDRFNAGDNVTVVGTVVRRWEWALL